MTAEMSVETAGGAERGERGGDHDETAVKAPLAPAGHRMVVLGQRPRAARIEDRDDR